MLRVLNTLVTENSGSVTLLYSIYGYMLSWYRAGSAGKNIHRIVQIAKLAVRSRNAMALILSWMI